LPGTIALAFSVLLVGSLPSLTSCAPNTMPGWASANSPNTPASDNQLFGVAAASAKDVFAVGYSTPTAGGLDQTLILHNGGTKWTPMSSQDTTGASDRLVGVSAFSANTAWAVGYSYNTATGERQPLIESYDGTTMTWQIVGGPTVPGILNRLYGVAAVSATEAWAVGESGSLNKPLIEHYVGGDWHLYSGPGVDTGADGCVLNGVAVVPSTNTLWAVGYCGNYYANAPTQPFIEHYDGNYWTPYPSTPTGTPNNILYGVAADSISDAWAVGYSQTAFGPQQSLIEHNNGGGWTPVTNSVNASVYNNALSGVAAVTSGDVWAVGNYTTGLSADAASYTLIEHLEGNNWAVKFSPNWSLENNYLTGVAVVPGTAPARLWAVGYYGHRHPTSPYQTFVMEH
jgi:hypothetical protein